MSKQDDGSFGVAVFALLVACFAMGVSFCAFVAKAEPCDCDPAPTPAACCDSKECRQGFAQVDARFGDVWDELVEVQEQLAKVKECCCEPPKPCACSDKPACECKPQQKTQLPVHRVFKRCK